jgi:hypothetical protein
MSVINIYTYDRKALECFMNSEVHIDTETKQKTLRKSVSDEVNILHE